MGASTGRKKSTKMNERGQKLNLDFLQEMAGGDLGFVTEILEIFTSDAPLTLDSIRTGIHEKDFCSIKTSVHKLKSSLKILGEDRLVDLAQCLEEDAENENASEEFLLRIAKLEKSVEQLVKDAHWQIKYFKNQS